MRIPSEACVRNSGQILDHGSLAENQCAILQQQTPARNNSSVSGELTVVFIENDVGCTAGSGEVQPNVWPEFASRISSNGRSSWMYPSDCHPFFAHQHSTDQPSQ